MREFIDFASSHGLIINHLTMGRISRCPTVGHKTKRNGAFFYAGDFGWVQNWSEHDSPILWKSGKAQDTPEFRRRITDSKKEYRIERDKLNAQAARKANWILSQCELNLSPYLARKGFPEMLGNIWNRDQQTRLLVIPMRRDGSLIGCQLIDDYGNKNFLRGQSSKDAYFQIGNGDKLFYVEGYASGLSLQKILQGLKISYRIIVAFSAGNIASLTKKTKGFIIADHDKSGTGQRVAMESGCPWYMPPKIGQDINDHHLESGVFKVSQELKRAIYPRGA
jgi:putative DNA primase/helicase